MKKPAVLRVLTRESRVGSIGSQTMHSALSAIRRQESHASNAPTPRHARRHRNLSGDLREQIVQGLIRMTRRDI